MRMKIGIAIGVTLLLGVGFLWYLSSYGSSSAPTLPPSFTETEEGFEDEPEFRAEELMTYRIGGGRNYTLQELRSWQRPGGPPRVGVQVGHLDNGVVPEELSGLTRNGAGATFGRYNERDTMSVIVEYVAAELESSGVEVDILPATVPPGYVADAFVAVHADGNLNTSVRGFKIAGPRRDYSGRSQALVEALEIAYGSETALPEDPNITRRMTAYYAFNWPRYEHAVHPYTPSAIVETGFLTNAADRALIVEEPRRAAAGIAAGILAYLEDIPEPTPPPQTLVAPTLPLTGTLECAPVRAERRDRDDRGCLPSVLVDGVHYALMTDAELATSTFPYRATVRGRYVPVQTLDNYFWFHWEVAGIIDDARIER